jgi:hypothetical protein
MALPGNRCIARMTSMGMPIAAFAAAIAVATGFRPAPTLSRFDYFNMVC